MAKRPIKEQRETVRKYGKNLVEGGDRPGQARSRPPLKPTEYYTPEIPRRPKGSDNK